jgi:hypothetical protein
VQGKQLVRAVQGKQLYLAARLTRLHAGITWAGQQSTAP